MVITPWDAPLGGWCRNQCLREGRPALCAQGFNFLMPLGVQISNAVSSKRRAKLLMRSGVLWRITSERIIQSLLHFWTTQKVTCWHSPIFLARIVSKSPRRIRLSDLTPRLSDAQTSSASSQTTPQSCGSAARCCWNRTTNGNCSAGIFRSKDSERSAIPKPTALSRHYGLRSNPRRKLLVYHSAGHDRLRASLARKNLRNALPRSYITRISLTTALLGRLFTLHAKLC